MMLQAMADVVKSHLDGNMACSRRLLNCCPLCCNPTCSDMKQFFAKSQTIIDHLHQWMLVLITVNHFSGPERARTIQCVCIQRIISELCDILHTWMFKLLDHLNPLSSLSLKITSVLVTEWQIFLWAVIVYVLLICAKLVGATLSEGFLIMSLWCLSYV